MPRQFSSAVCVTALLLAGAGNLVVATPAAAAITMRIGFDFFHDRLAPYGRWMRHPIWGDVWRPRSRLVGADFQPYLNGYWQYTDEYGWYWVSDDPFDDVVYHYGRWVYDPQWGWLWLPGYTWAPAWVVWREGEDYTGWAPLPPDEAFVSGAGLSFGVDLGPLAINFYDRWYRGRVDPSRFFVFVDNRHLVERNYRRFVVPRERVKVVLGRTREVTKFEVANGRVVNRGVDLKIVERAAGHPVARVSAKAVIKPNAVVTTVEEAKQVRERERVAHPVNVEAIRRGNAAAQDMPGAADDMKRGRRGGSEAGPAAGMGEEHGPSRASPGSDEGAEPGSQKGGAASTPPAGGTEPAPGQTPRRKSATPTEGRMSNPAGEEMNSPGTPASRASGSPEASPAGGEGTEQGAPARHRPRPLGSSGAQGSDAGSSPAGGEGTPPGGAGMHRPRPGPSSGGMSGPPPASTTGGAPGRGSSPAQPAPEPKKKQKPATTDQSEAAPH
ncbi:MAG: hypothetical protein JOY77_07915 [Alphaproteobacteria bacterium]|nr:hypothetical protein [Alphaproteobacteria bacterium]MBV9062842.1 hypothetical protein [Alphaproteobacteria bacterium]